MTDFETIAREKFERALRGEVRPEFSGVGWAEGDDAAPSEPIVAETPYTDVTPDAAHLAEVAQAKFARATAATEPSEPVPEGTTRADLRHQPAGARGRPG